MKKFTLEAPWNTYQKKVKALFDPDPDIIVGDVYKMDEETADYEFDVEVRNHEKYVALDRVLPKYKEIGNVTVHINLFDEENGGVNQDAVDIYKTIFTGNPIVKDIKDVVDFTGTRHGFVRFQPEVIQFFHDDISDYNGNWSGLAQDIAREVFEGEFRGVHFCTASLEENENGEIVGGHQGECP